MTKDKIEITVQGKEYTFLADLNGMLQDAQEMKNYNPEDKNFGDYDKGQYENMPISSIEDYQANIDMMIQDIRNIMGTPQVLEKIIMNMSHKKDGWLRKGTVGIYNNYTKTARWWDDSYCHVMYSIRGKAIDDRTVELSLERCERYAY